MDLEYAETACCVRVEPDEHGGGILGDARVVVLDLFALSLCTVPIRRFVENRGVLALSRPLPLSLLIILKTIPRIVPRGRVSKLRVVFDIAQSGQL